MSDPGSEPSDEEDRHRRRDSCDCDPGCDLPGCDHCDLPGCDLPCDIGIVMRLSTLLALAAVLPPPRGVVLAGLRGYRRWLSPRLPTHCPCTPSCSMYATQAVTRFGARRGLRLAAARLRRCGAVNGPEPL